MELSDKFGQKAIRDGKKTEWIYVDNWEMGCGYKCSLCGCSISVSRKMGDFLPDECPNCGADMRGEHGGMDKR